MKKIIFTNAEGQSIEFSATSKYKLKNADDLGGLESVIQTTKSPYQDGATPVGGSYFDTKIISIEFVLISESLDSDMRTLFSILNPKNGAGQLTIVMENKSYSLEKVIARVLPTRPGKKDRGKNFQVSEIIFEAFNPYYADETFNEAEVTTGGLLFEFPLEITDNFEFDFINTLGTLVTNAGDVECPITLIMDGPMSSPLEVINETTGEKIVLTMALLENERLTITTELENTNVIKTDLNTGTETVAFQYIDVAETTFFSLAKGDNLIKIFAGEAEVEQTTIRFKQQFVGV